jgi:hypothetical protein
MSRSRRHTPIFGHAIGSSEKDDKQRAAMRERKKAHDSLKPHLASDTDFDMANFTEHPRSGQWTFNKDGKSYRNRATSRDMRK